MDTIQLKTDLSKLIPIYSSQEYDIYEYGEYLIKIFNTDDKDILINKQNKVEILNSLNISDIKALVEQKGLFRGFIMEKKDGFSSLEEKLYKVSRRQKMKDLRDIKAKLDELHKNGIILGDLTLRNIISDKQDLYLCNLDNCCIGKYGFDYPNFNQQRYLSIVSEIDDKLDNYMFNLLTIIYLEKVVEQGILHYITNERPRFMMDTRRNEGILEDMVYLKEENKDNIGLLIDNMRYVKKR